MKQIAEALKQIVHEYAPKLEAYAGSDFTHKPAPGKWSKQELLGHLIDSGHNNLRRFVVTQYEENPHVVYDQDFWVSVNGYQHMVKDEVILLWTLVNERICEVLNSMPEANYLKECNTGKSINEFHSLQWLAADYVKHLKYHMNQVLPGSFPDIKY
jgi:hypothetical protein